MRYSTLTMILAIPKRKVVMRCSSPKELSSIPRSLRTPLLVQNLAPRSDFSIFSDLENRELNLESVSKSILPRSPPLSKTPNYKFLRRAPIRRGRKFKSLGFVGWLTATSNH
ncbi:hypothetical protein AVEN_145436-1 [Araneus ventricosus]|uniref:Uncharacterized protein n=1 Tax=Araneus ventricosus TaxID=182803 RepID=A0A4Y2SKY6_ARAVE|nr:hypothetical protein AVEN_75417-1 [Araneus ventricosus]GBN88551.1 hypothetical protein AVEN_145436-1 [Araneus ventricosus]